MCTRVRLSAVVLFAVALSAVSLGLPLDPASAQTAQPFDKGKTVTIFFGATVGGGHHGYATLIGRHLGKHLPGNPTVVVKAMPGGGSRTLANYLSFKAAKD